MYIEAVRATGLADKIIVEEYEGQKIDDIRRYDVDIFTVGSDWAGKFDYLNIDGGNFKARIGNTTYLVGVFFNKAKKVTIEDRMKNLICQEVTAGNF